MINDAHCHFFSETFFDALGRQRGLGESVDRLVTTELGWDVPGPAETLADRWVRELDANEVARAAIIASIPGDEAAVAEAVAHQPTRFVGFFMLDPAGTDAPDRAYRAVTTLGLRGICLFPAMHHVPMQDKRVAAVLDIAAGKPGTAVFVHCGLLSVGVRKKLRLVTRFDLRLGNPLDLTSVASVYPALPFIVPHFGAGMFREALMLADTCPNVYLDTSSSNAWMRYIPGLTLETVFRHALDVVGPSRLLFGTDSSFFPRGWQKPIYEAQKQALGALKVSADDQALIFGGNFDRLFA